MDKNHHNLVKEHAIISKAYNMATMYIDTATVRKHFSRSTGPLQKLFQNALNPSWR